MSLLEKLKNDRDACVERYKRLEKNLEVCKRELEKCDADWGDFNVAIAALEPAPVPEPETFPAASASWEPVRDADGHFSDCAIYNEPAFPAGPCDCGNQASAGASDPHATSPGEVEESRDQFDDEAQRAAAIELTADVEPIPQPEWNEPEQNDYDTTGVLTADDMQAVAMPNYAEYPAPVTEGYAPVTNPEADALAKAYDYYDPKAVAERNRFNPWGGVSHLFGKPKVDA